MPKIRLSSLTAILILAIDPPEATQARGNYIIKHASPPLSKGFHGIAWDKAKMTKTAAATATLKQMI